MSGRTDNAVGNLQNAAANGLKHGASGLLNTEWGDSGHWQPPAISLLALAYGAGVSWSYEASRSIDLPTALDRFVFEDSAGVMGRLAYDLGNLYLIPGLAHSNGHRLFDTLQSPLDAAKRSFEQAEPLVTADTLHTVLAKLDMIMQPLNAAQMRREDAELIRSEFQLVADLLRHAVYRGLWIIGQPVLTPGELLADLEKLVFHYRGNWLARSRPGGLDESVRRFETALAEYREALQE